MGVDLLRRLQAALDRRRTPRTSQRQGTTLARGHEAERQAETYLTSCGLRLLARNLRAGRGEIDLVMADGNTLVFVEVRARKIGAPVSATESITPTKQRKLRETAERLLQSTPEWQDRTCRFDVIAVQLAAADHPSAIDWIPDAFS